MAGLETICGFLARLAPLKLAETWDNVGLLVGDRRGDADRVMTCLTISPCVVSEAIAENASLIITHHPLPFRPLSRITSDTVTGSMLLELIGNGVAVYSAHTAFDSASEGINQMWGELLGLENIQPLVDLDTEAIGGADSPHSIGSGRCGTLAQPERAGDLILRAASAVQASAPRIAGDPDRPVSKVALACGSGGSFLHAAARRGCDVMITGEATFHDCLEAESRGMGLGLLGHYFSERFAMERLADSLTQEFPDLAVWASQNEHDPLTSL